MFTKTGIPHHLHEWRGGEEFDARNGGRLDSGGEEFDFS